MGEIKPVKIVPNGKVYRQMFDAQSQLNNGLFKLKNKKALPALVNVGRTSVFRPLISALEYTANDSRHGFLTRRQRAWTDSFPNDQVTENPVHYKHYADNIREQQSLHVAVLETKEEVRGLPDTVVAKSKCSNVIGRIETNRKARHESAVENMYQDLHVISLDMESKITDVCQSAMDKLSENSVQLSKLQADVEGTKDLLSCSLTEFEALWEEIEELSRKRQRCIKELDASLKTLEEERMCLIREMFQDYAITLERISYLLPSDLQQFLDKESQAVNQTCLSNRRVYADLFARLLSADVEGERVHRVHWRRRVNSWRKQKTELAVESFRQVMSSDEVTNPPGFTSVIDFMVTELEVLNTHRRDLIAAVSDMKPPALTNPAVNTWRQKVEKVTADVDTVTEMHMSKLHMEMERVCQTCLMEMECTKRALLADRVIGVAGDKQIEEQMLSLVGQQRRAFEQRLDAMLKDHEAQKQSQEDELLLMFKFTEGVANLWDVHEIGLAQQERNLQDKLDHIRLKHDIHNREQEVKLDTVLDSMRQGATEETLRDRLSRALKMLNVIFDSYCQFHKQQTDIVRTYPKMMQVEFHKFYKAVCTFFSVDRAHPEDTREQETSCPPVDGDRGMDSDGDEFGSLPQSTSMQAANLSNVSVALTVEDTRLLDVASRKPLGRVVEVLSVENGTTFYVLSRRGDNDDADCARDSSVVGSEPLTDHHRSTSVIDILHGVPDPETDDVAIPDFPRCTNIARADIINGMKKIRLSFLTHLEMCSMEVENRADDVVVSKCDELNGELDLRLHLHQHRPQRVELDIHNVRAAELVMHAQRVTGHCAGIEVFLEELMSQFHRMSSDHSDLARKYREDIEAAETIFVNVTKSSELISLQNKLSTSQDQFMEVIRTSLRQFRQHVDDRLQILRQSNSHFLTSVKLFSDGGNFCPEEIAQHRKRLEKSNSKITSAESSILTELECMQAKRLDAVTKMSLESDDKFKMHIADLEFAETVLRWLTNTQVHIKSEVSASNSQASTLASHLTRLESLIDACSKPNFDKESVTPSQLSDFLKVTMSDFYSRSEYLNCLKNLTTNQPPANASPPASITPAPKASVVDSSSMLPNVCKLSRQQSEDPSIGIIRAILTRRSQKVALNGCKLLFCEQSVDNETSNGADEKRHFLTRIEQVLQKSLDGLLSTAEAYYRQKGSRLVTRPHILQETPEQFQEIISQKLISYYSQCEDYRNMCLQELRKQLLGLEKLAADVPVLIIRDVLRVHVEKLELSHSTLRQQYQTEVDAYRRKQLEHQSCLRPSLGHPHHSTRLQALCDKETAGHRETLDVVARRADALTTASREHLQELTYALSSTCESLLMQYDKLLVESDVEKGRLPSIQPITDGKPGREQLTPMVTTMKTTLAHCAAVSTRDAVYEEYKTHHCQKTMVNIEEEKEEQVREEERRHNNWMNSVQHIKALYSSDATQ